MNTEKTALGGEMPLVSVIVPVYNAEKTLDRCVESICAQEYPYLEILLVNDGSTDGSADICRAWAEKDARVRVLSQENGGVSRARNAALDAAKGEFIRFADSDDYLPEHAIDTLVYRACRTDCDLVLGEFYRVNGGTLFMSRNLLSVTELSKQEFCRLFMTAPHNFYYGVVWNKLYRASVLAENKIRFDTQLHFCEDFMFNMDFYMHMRAAAVIDTPVYAYVRRKGSLLYTGIAESLLKQIRQRLSMFDTYKEMFRSTEMYDKYRLQIYSFLISFATDIIPVHRMEADAQDAFDRAMRHGRARRRRIRRYIRQVNAVRGGRRKKSKRRSVRKTV